MALQKTQKKSPKKTIFTSVLVAALLAVSYGLYAYAFDQWPFADNSSSSQSESSSSDDHSDDEDFIDDQPATDEDQEAANKKKEEAYNKQNTDQSSGDNSTSNKSPNNQSTVNVSLTTFYQEGGSIHANGFVSGVIENDGICKLTLTNESGKSVSVTRKGHVNATNTTCGQSIIKLSKLTPGKWTPELSYSSDTSVGTTGPKAWDPIEVK